jgi:rhodanese-related sulfurtransferase
MALRNISPEQARALLDQGALLLDIREADEHARERIAQAKHLPLSKLDTIAIPFNEGKPVIFHCRSGMRTATNATRLRASTDESCDCYMVEGGLDAWRKAGLPVVADRNQPLDIMRQVQIGAGSMGLIGTLLGLLVSPWFFIVPAFVGSGLLVAGLTGFCGMARMLMIAPWNRRALASKTA